MIAAPATLDRAAIAARIPHRGSMCLLDAVEAWDERGIRCRAVSHRAPDNPLRDGAALPAASAIEYAAQAMAVHGALLAPPAAAPRMGFLASVRGVALHVARLDTLAAELEIRAERVSGDDDNILYAFTVSAAGAPVASGRAAVILDAGRLAGAFSGSPA